METGKLTHQQRMEQLCSSIAPSQMESAEIKAEFLGNKQRLDSGNLAGWLSCRLESRQSELARIYIEGKIENGK